MPSRKNPGRSLLLALGCTALALLALAAPTVQSAAAGYDPPERAVEVEVPPVDGVFAPPLPPQPQPPLRGQDRKLEAATDDDDKSMHGHHGQKSQPPHQPDNQDRKPHLNIQHPTPEQLHQLQQLVAGAANAPAAQRVYRADRLLNCAWSPVLGPDKDKPFLPDLNIQYNMQGFVFASNAPKRRAEQAQAHPHAAHAASAASAVHQAKRDHLEHKQHEHPAPTPAPTPLPFADEEVYRIRARYPWARYFSFTTYDLRLQTVATLHDTQIKPSFGKNPYADPTAGEAEAGGYEIYITKDGRHGYPNEMAALRPNASSVYGLLSFRIQLLDPRAGPDRSGRNRDWGYVDMPVVEIRNPRSGQFEPVRRCTEQMQAQEEDFIEHLDVSFNKWWPRRLQLGADCNASDFYLFDAERNPIIRRAVAVRNDEENYVFWCMPREVLADKQYVVRITGLLPRTPSGLFEPGARVAEPWTYDARYVSFTSADAAPLYPSYQTLHDSAIRAHYTGGDPARQASWDRRYSIIAAVDPGMAQRCGLYDPNKDLLLRFAHPPLPSPPHNPAVVMRELHPSGGTVRSSTGEGVGGVEREGVASVSLRNECVGPDGKLKCEPAAAARSLLHDFYPKVEVYVCQPPGKGHGHGHGHGQIKQKLGVGHGKDDGPLTPMRIY